MNSQVLIIGCNNDQYCSNLISLVSHPIIYLFFFGVFFGSAVYKNSLLWNHMRVNCSDIPSPLRVLVCEFLLTILLPNHGTDTRVNQTFILLHHHHLILQSLLLSQECPFF